ncbi:hypothetical protein FACS1894187_13860 [Synergistales bacterium]|nr:hypothetical protein FACS1894187_13860 [Synergistales bacterium]
MPTSNAAITIRMNDYINHSTSSTGPVTLKVKYSDFREMSKRRTFPKIIKDFVTFWTVAKELLNAVEFGNDKKIRLMGLTVSNTEYKIDDRQLRFDFGDEDGNEREGS